MNTPITLSGVTEYTEGHEIELVETQGSYCGEEKERIGNGRLAIRAYNEGGCSFTDIDLIELIDWVKAHCPELIGE